MKTKILLFSALFLLAGCHFFDDFEDTPEDCPLNSGYPCPCDPGHKGVEDLKSTCDDGSFCDYMGDNDKKGACIKLCDDHDECSDGVDYGLDTMCASIEGQEISTCFVICGSEENEGSCPPGLECLEIRSDLGLCFPPIKEQQVEGPD